MKDLYENIAYLRGLAEGISVEEESKEGKLLVGIIDVLEDLTAEVEDLCYDFDDVEEYLTFLDDDLTDVEEVVFDFDEDYFDFDDDLDYEEFLEDEDLEDEDEE